MCLNVCAATAGAYRTEDSKNELDKRSESERGEAKRRQVKDANDLIEKLENTSQLVALTNSHVKQHRVVSGSLAFLQFYSNCQGHSLGVE